VPLADRDRLPVFLSRGAIVWVPGLPVSEAHKVTERTREIFSIRVSARMRRGRSRR
jgi:hypothetical protein